MNHPSLPAAGSSLYRRVWRWHFYAGLVCLPFLVLLATTGALYLFKVPLESLVYAELLTVRTATGPGLEAQAVVDKALAVESGDAVRFVAPSEPGRSVEVGVRTADGVVAVYLDPADGRVLGTLRDDLRLMEIVKRIHSLAIAGPVGNHWVEVVAGWAIVLVVSGVFLWWPRGRAGGVYSVRAEPTQRLWWRDLHAVTGITAAGLIVFLAVTGMPWSAFWGEQFGRLTRAWGIGVPEPVWGAPPRSSPPAASTEGGTPWALTHVPLPRSQPLDAQHHAAPAAAPFAATTGGATLGLNEALRILARMGLPAGTPVRLPDGPHGVYTAMRLPDDVRDVRVVHLDRYSGAVLADIRYADYGVAARVTEWGISIHTGRQFGWVNQVVMLAGCMSIVALAMSAAVMWWKRRPQGRLAAPPRRSGDRAAAGAIAAAVCLGLVYPLLGASMLVALLVDAVVPTNRRRRWGL